MTFEAVVLGEGLMVIWLDRGVYTQSPRRAIWSEARTRKVHVCWGCGEHQDVGSMLFRSVGNQDYRMKRLCGTCVAAAIGEA